MNLFLPSMGEWTGFHSLEGFYKMLPGLQRRVGLYYWKLKPVTANPPRPWLPVFCLPHAFHYTRTWPAIPVCLKFNSRSET